MKLSVGLNAVLFAGLACAGFAETKTAELKGSRPNIILVMTDDQGQNGLSCLGDPAVQTPYIDKFHAQATRFSDFQVSPTCAPTRAALMSGRVPFKNGVTHTIFQRERMALDTFTIAQALSSAGYETGIFGKWHLGDEEDRLPGNRGFNEALIHGAGGIGQTRYGDFPANEVNPYFDNVLLHNETIVQTKGFCTDVFFQSALAWIKQHNAAKTPYFAFVSLNAPHYPMCAPEKYKKRFLEMGYDEGSAGRYGMIENIDDNFGMMMDKLNEWNALENTVVIFMTDNGATHLKGKLNGAPVVHFNGNLKGAKNTPFEGGTRVPAFWQWKGVLSEGVDVTALTAHVDLYKTFCELAGVTLPSDAQELDGRSLLPLLENPTAAWPERELFFHCGRWAAGKLDAAKFSKCAVRSDRWRFVNNRELYDISNDPGETTDVSAAFPEVVDQMRKSYDKWWASVLPLMVNEGLPLVAPEDQPLAIRYTKQLEEQGIPEWAPAEL